MYECSKYTWWEKREHCSTEPDRKFSSKRMALLYIAKKNSDCFQIWLQESSREWSSACPDSGIHAVTPNAPFDLESFLDLPDDVLEQYARGLRNLLSVHKAPQGTVYRCQAAGTETTTPRELFQILTA